MSNWEIFWYIFRWVVLIFVVVLYLILVFLSSTDEPSIRLTPKEKAAFDRSMTLNNKAMLRLQGWLMGIAGIDLIIFDSRWYVIAAFVCACELATSFYRASRIIIGRNHEEEGEERG